MATMTPYLYATSPAALRHEARYQDHLGRASARFAARLRHDARQQGPEMRHALRESARNHDTYAAGYLAHARYLRVTAAR